MEKTFELKQELLKNYFLFDEDEANCFEKLEEDDDLHYERLDLIKEYLVEEHYFSCGGDENTIGDNTDYKIVGDTFVVNVEYYDDRGNPDLCY